MMIKVLLQLGIVEIDEALYAKATEHSTLR